MGEVEEGQEVGEEEKEAGGGAAGRHRHGDDDGEAGSVVEAIWRR